MSGAAVFSAGFFGLERVTKIREAQFAYCDDCGSWLGCQYWSLAKSVGLHKRGTAHAVTLYRYEK